MAVITIPDNLSCDAFSWGQSRNTINFKSPFGTQSVDVRSPWWTATLSAPVGYEKDAGNWQSLMMSLGGATNQLAMHNLARPTPVGTLRGNMTFNSYTPVGATTINIDSAAGGGGGKEFISNGTFDSGTSGWSQNDTGNPTMTVSDGVVVCNSGTTSNVLISQTIPTTVGKSYTVSYLKISTESLAIYVDSSIDAFYAGSGVFSRNFIATATSSTIQIVGLGTNATGTLDNISCTESNRGINLLTFPEDFSNTAWNKSNCFTSVTVNTSVSPDRTLTSDTLVKNTTVTTNWSQLSQVAIVGAGNNVGKTYTASVWLSCPSGTLSGTLAISDVQYATYVGAVNITTTPTRFYFTSSGGVAGWSGLGTQIGIGIDVPNSSTIVAWGAKLETGSIATDYGYGKTLLKGDYIGFGSGVTQQVCMVVADSVSTSQGYIPVSIQPPLRNAFTQGSTITWDKPKVLFRQQENTSSWDYDSTLSSGYKMSLLEDPRP
jgi:hypothetical protein